MNIGLRLRVFLIILAAIIAIGTFGFMLTERLSLADAFYFSIVTVATVGYGDISPVTTAGKILSIFLIITGVGSFLGVVANATELLLNKQEHRERMEKLNMVIASFYSEAGTQLMTTLVGSDPHVESIATELIVTSKWSDQQFSSAKGLVKEHEFSIDISRMDLEALSIFITEKGNLFLRLLENPSILEHQIFTDLLRASLHLKEELQYRSDFNRLPKSDLLHIAVDVKRVYSLLVYQWIDYMKYLKDHYPYLFSLAVRTNPFDKARSVIVTQ